MKFGKKLLVAHKAGWRYIDYKFLKNILKALQSKDVSRILFFLKHHQI